MAITETLPLDSADDSGLLPGETLDAHGEVIPPLSTVQQSLMLPVKNKLITLTDRDSCIDAFEYLTEIDRNIAAAKLTLRTAIGRMATDKDGDNTSKTRHVRHSDGRDAVVTMPSEEWDDAAVKKIWSACENLNLRDEFLRVDKVKVNVTPFEVALKTDGGSDEFNLFIAKLKTCLLSATGTPTVKIEQAKLPGGKNGKSSKAAAKNIVDAESVKAVVEVAELQTREGSTISFDDI